MQIMKSLLVYSRISLKYRNVTGNLITFLHKHTFNSDIHKTVLREVTFIQKLFCKNYQLQMY